MKALLLKLLDYLRYPSTWKGIITILGALGVTFAPEFAEQITLAAVSLVGVIFTLFSDSDVKPVTVTKKK